MHFVIFDTRKDLALRARRFLTQSVIFQIRFDLDRQLRIAQGTRVLNLDEGLVAVLGSLSAVLFRTFHLRIAPDIQSDL